MTYCLGNAAQRFALPACGRDWITLINQYKPTARNKVYKNATNPTGQVHALLGFVVMFHSDDYISLFVSFINIPVSLNNLFQRIASIYDRF